MSVWRTCRIWLVPGALTMALILTVPVPCLAQEASATLSSTVVDESGAVVPGAAVTVENRETGLQRRMVTDEQGACVFPALPAGTYRLNAQLAGFAPIGEQQVVLRAEDKVAVVLKMRVAGVDEAVVVTAQRRGDERLQDVPIPVTVVNTDTLIANNIVQLRDFAATVPGFNFAPSNGGQSRPSIRGITTGGNTNPNVALVIDDVPQGGSIVGTNGSAGPDIDPADLSRIEVLRGPQGTLYGANSMGGLIRLVTKDPSLDALSGHVQVGSNSTYNSSSPGYNLRAAVNIPVSDTVAIRASGFTRRDAGYTKNVRTGQDNFNEANVHSARLSALLQPSQNFSLKLSAIYQDTSAGYPEAYIRPGLGDLEQTFLPDAGHYDRTDQSYIARLNATLRHVNLTSVTGYNSARYTDSVDYTNIYGPVLYHQDNDPGKFSQEFRVGAPIGRKVHWLGGGYYTHERRRAYIFLDRVSAATGQFPDVILDLESYYSEYAVFSDITYQATTRFDVQVGGRQSWITAGDRAPRREAQDRAFTYLLAPRFRVSPHFIVFARFASGYRPGGPNNWPGSSFEAEARAAALPAQFAPDTTQNYEIGLKSDVLDGRLSLDASLYHIDWSDIQLTLRAPRADGSTITYTENGGTAKSEGVELSVGAKPLAGLTLSAWMTYINAVLAEAFPSSATAHGAKGDRIPHTSRWSGQLSLDQEFPLWSGVNGFAGGRVNVVGDRIGPFQSTPLRQLFPGYTNVDVHGGVRHEAWTINAYVTNVADKRGLLSGGIGYPTPDAFHFIRPRTVGLNVVRGF